MSRTLSAAMSAAIFSQETDEAVVTLVELHNDGWASPVRLANAGADVTSGGAVYTALGFTIAMPDDEDEARAIARWVADNAGQEIIGQLRQTVGVISVIVRYVLASQPDTLEAGFTAELPEISYDVSTITGGLTVDPVLDDAFAKDRFDARKFPGLYR